MIYFLIALSSFTLVHGYAPLREPSGSYSEANFLQDAMERMNRDIDGDGTFFDIGNRMGSMDPLNLGILPGRTTKDNEFMEGGGDYDLMMGHYPSIRDSEYLQQSSLWGNKYISGGEAEPQKIKGLKAQTEVKTDAVLPAYCNPPNPCPVGYTSEDGCIENFENSASFSRAYQASQDCMCDTEHMFDCQIQQQSEDNDLDLGQHDFLSDLQNLGGEHKVIAKKFYTTKTHSERLNKLNQLAKEAATKRGIHGVRPENNPFLAGEKLPIAAKKGFHH